MDVGEALAGYVQYGRPRCAGRPLLVILRAPYTGLLRAHILAVVHRACQRAGIPVFGAHQLRHAVACDLLRRGASLAEVGQLLRHWDERTTAIYANPRELHQPGEKPQVAWSAQDGSRRRHAITAAS